MMGQKILLSGWLFVFALGNLASAQSNIQQENVLRKYNATLKALNLSDLIIATDLSFQKEFSKTFDGKISVDRKNVNVLIIQPAAAIRDTLAFIAAWKELNSSSKGTALYPLLFTKLLKNSDIEPDSLLIYLKLKQEKIFSAVIYYDHAIKLSQNHLDLKGNINTTEINNVINDDLTSGTINDVPETQLLYNKIGTSTTAFLQAHKGKVVGPKASSGRVSFGVKYIGGPITGGHEQTKLDIFILPSIHKGFVSLFFTFKATYAGGAPGSEPAPENFVEVGRYFYNKTKDFKVELAEVLDRLRKKF